jgi:multidrug resistance efflux pump
MMTSLHPPTHRRPRTSRPRLPAAALVVASLALSGAGCGGAGGEPVARAASDAPVASLAARRGDFDHRVLLTGELEASEAVDFVVPRVPSFQVEVRWMLEDGSLVRAGDKVLELDSSSFTTDLEDKEISLSEKLAELERLRAQALLNEREKEFALAQAEAELEKARLDADVPAELRSRREHEEARLALEKAQTAVAKAREDLGSTRETSRSDIAVQRIEIDKSRREIVVARESIDELLFVAPRDGIFLVSDHPWQGRKIQLGDQVPRGTSVARLPDLGSLVVTASLADVDDGEIAVGMPVEVVLDAHPDRVYGGRVESVASIAQEEDSSSSRRYFQVTVLLDEIDRDRMIPGMSVRAEVLSNHREDVLLVPRVALGRIVDSEDPGAGGSEGETATRRQRVHLASGGTAEVEVGPCDELDCVVREGLEGGTRLAAAPPEPLVIEAPEAPAPPPEPRTAEAGHPGGPRADGGSP